LRAVVKLFHDPFFFPSKNTDGREMSVHGTYEPNYTVDPTISNFQGNEKQFERAGVPDDL